MSFSTLADENRNKLWTFVSSQELFPVVLRGIFFPGLGYSPPMHLSKNSRGPSARVWSALSLKGCSPANLPCTLWALSSLSPQLHFLNLGKPPGPSPCHSLESHSGNWLIISFAFQLRDPYASLPNVDTLKTIALYILTGLFFGLFSDQRISLIFLTPSWPNTVLFFNIKIWAIVIILWNHDFSPLEKSPD